MLRRPPSSPDDDGVALLVVLSRSLDLSTPPVAAASSGFELLHPIGGLGAPGEVEEASDGSLTAHACPQLWAAPQTSKVR